MSVGADAADQAVRESIMITESITRLAAMGAKNLAALVLALLADQTKLSGKTNLKTLIKEGKEPAIFPLKERDLNAFKKQAKKYGILFTVVKSDGKDTVDIIAKAEDVQKINTVLSNLGYGTLGKETESKNVETRAQSSTASKERGDGLEASRESVNMTMNKDNPDKSPAEIISTAAKQFRFDVAKDGQNGIETLGSKTLALIAISLLGEELNVFEKGRLKKELSDIALNSKEPLTFTINSHDLVALSNAAENRGFTYCRVPNLTGYDTQIIADTKDIAVIRLAMNDIGYSEVVPQQPAQETKKRGRSPKKRESVVNAVGNAKEKITDKKLDKMAEKDNPKKEISVVDAIEGVKAEVAKGASHVVKKKQTPAPERGG